MCCKCDEYRVNRCVGNKMALKSARNSANWFRRFGRNQSNVVASVWGRQVQPGCCPVSKRLAKQLSKKISASFELTGKPQWENFCLANRSLTGHGPVHNNTIIILFTGAKIKGGWQQETNIILHTKVNHHQKITSLKSIDDFSRNLLKERKNKL